MLDGGLSFAVWRSTGLRRGRLDSGRHPAAEVRALPWRPVHILYAALFALGGCGLLPHDGPSIAAVRDGASGTKGGYSLVELNANSGAIIESVPKPALLGLGPASSTVPVDLIGVGDGLTVTVYDRGSDALGIGPMSSGSLPKVAVDNHGDITLPYAGNIHVAGLTAAQASQAIGNALKGIAVRPQVVVSITDNVANSVTIVGEVRNPGRYALADGSDHILDILALAAGPVKPPGDTRVVVVRDAMTANVSLLQLLNDNSQNIRLAPRDQIRFLYQPRRFSTFGALGHPSEIPIEDETLTLAGALSRAGGLDAGTANASAVLLFRFERSQVADALSVHAPVSPKGVPIVYHLDLRDPEGLFVANRFEVEPSDLIYVPRSSFSEVQQFMTIVSAASTVAYNLRVTSAVLP
jgi:polysaccharide export outer membrane protein